MIEYLKTFKGIVNQLTKTEMKIDDELQTLILLSSMPESWDTLVVTLSNSAPKRKLSMDSVTNSLLNEESRRRERGLNNQFEANLLTTEEGVRIMKKEVVENHKANPNLAQD